MNTMRENDQMENENEEVTKTPINVEEDYVKNQLMKQIWSTNVKNFDVVVDEICNQNVENVELKDKSDEQSDTFNFQSSPSKQSTLIQTHIPRKDIPQQSTKRSAAVSRKLCCQKRNQIISFTMKSMPRFQHKKSPIRSGEFLPA